MAKRPPKQTHYERSEAYAKQVSGEIIEQIKKGTAPWQKPWKPGEQIGATNVATGKAYTGGNSLYLMSRQISEGRGDNRWGTYRQIEAAGGQVRRGEKGTQVLFYQNRTERPARDEAGKIRKDKEGNTIYEETENARPVMRQYTVFNVEQADGLKLPPRESPTTIWCAMPCGIARIISWWERSGAARRRTCCKPSTLDTAGHSRPYTPTMPRVPYPESPVVPCKAAGSFPGKSPAEGWWTESLW